MPIYLEIFRQCVAAVSAVLLCVLLAGWTAYELRRRIGGRIARLLASFARSPLSARILLTGFQQSTRAPWTYYDYDEKGREICRIEQLDGSAFPSLDAVRLDVPLSVSAKVTVTDYDPLPGDSGHCNDADEPRVVTTYVRRNGGAPVAVSREARTYVRSSAGGLPLRRVETVHGMAPLTNAAVVVAYPDEAAVPKHLRGREVYGRDVDGVETTTAYELLSGGDVLRATVRRFCGGRPHDTYKVVDSDAAHRLPLREEIRLTAGDALLEWSENLHDDRRRLRCRRFSDGTSETNVYSCCRLLWSRDREGRKTLRSAQTGHDMMYYADEAVWLNDVATNGYKVVQHFFDGLGRETNTVTYAGTTPGEATGTMGVLPVAGSSRSAGLQVRGSAAVYPYGGDDYVVRTDERGKVTTTETENFPDRTVVTETTATNGTDVLVTTTTAIRNGATTVRRAWGGNFIEEARFDAYAADGTRRAYVVTTSSDCGTVTNSVTAYDFLGRMTNTTTALTTTTYTYDGATSRIAVETGRAVCPKPPQSAPDENGTPSEIEIVTTHLYNEFGEEAGLARFGVTNRSDIAYAFISNVWWKVTTDSTTAQGGDERPDRHPRTADRACRRAACAENDRCAGRCEEHN